MLTGIGKYVNKRGQTLFFTGAYTASDNARTPCKKLVVWLRRLLYYNLLNTLMSHSDSEYIILVYLVKLQGDRVRYVKVRPLDYSIY